MKTFIVALLALVFLVTGIFFYASYLNSAASELERIIETVSVLAYNEQWSECKKETDKLLKKWSENEAVLAMFNDHEDVDSVKLSIGELKESVSHKSKEHTFKSLTEAKILLERLKKNETLSLENILGLAPQGLSCHNML